MASDQELPYVSLRETQEDVKARRAPRCGGCYAPLSRPFRPRANALASARAHARLGVPRRRKRLESVLIRCALGSHAASGRASRQSARHSSSALTTFVKNLLSRKTVSFPRAAAPRRAPRADAFGLDPPSPRLGDRVNVTAAGTFREGTRGTDAEKKPTVSVRVFRRAFSRRFAVSKTRGSLRGDVARPVSAAADAGRVTIRGELDVPPDAPAGWYRVVLDVAQEGAALFCVDARVKFRRAEDASRGARARSEKRLRRDARTSRAFASDAPSVFSTKER